LTPGDTPVSEYPNKVFDDRLFLQCIERPRSAQCRECSVTSVDQPRVWLSRVQRAVRPMRAYHSQDHRRDPERRESRLPGRLRLRAARRGWHAL